MVQESRRAIFKGGLALVAGCAASPVWAQSNAPIRIGLLTPLSGPQQIVGMAVKNGAEVAITQINKAGGVLGRPLELVVRDDKASPAAAVAAAKELLADRINFHIGSISSAVALALVPVMQQEGGILITSGAGTEKLNHENYSPNVFRVGDPPDTRGRAMAKLMAERYPDVLRWTGMIPDHEYGRTTWSIFVDGLLEFYPAITGRRPEIVDPVLLPYGAADYRSGITAMMRRSADGLYNSTYGGDAVTLFQQAAGFGMVKRFKVVCDSSNEFLVARALKGAGFPHWSALHYYPAVNKGNPVNDQFIADYIAKTDDPEPLGVVGEAHAGIQALARAIQAAGSTETAAVIARLKGLSWQSVTGPRTIRPEDNQAVKDVEIIHLEPDASVAAGYRMTEYIRVDGNSVILPPSPGRAPALRKA